MSDHKEDWNDTTCPVALCSECRQPWPCETELELRTTSSSSGGDHHCPEVRLVYPVVAVQSDDGREWVRVVTEEGGDE